MITKREPTQIRKLGPDITETPISHNCQEKALDLLVEELKKMWRLEDGHKIKFVLNEKLPENCGFIYDPKRMIMFKFKGGKFEYSEIDPELVRVAMVQNSART